MQWIGIIMILALIYIGVDYGRLVVKSRRLEQESETTFEFTPYLPTRYIMIDANESQYITDLVTMDVKAHLQAGISIKYSEENKDKGILLKTIFENGDELIVYDYNNAQIAPLTKQEINNYSQKLFFDYKLPKGAERAIIEQLGLVDYMVNIGICSEKSGGK